jgi:hypothetical protein
MVGTGAGDAGGFRYFPSFKSDFLLSFSVDDQFYRFKYQVLLINHFTCSDKDHYILGKNGLNY